MIVVVLFVIAVPAAAQSTLKTQPYLLKATEMDNLSKKLKRWETVTINDFDVFLKNYSGSTDKSIVLKTPTQSFSLKLEENEIRSNSYKAFVQTGGQDVEVANQKPCFTFKGTVNNDSKSWVRLSINELGIKGVLFQNGKYTCIEPLNQVLDNSLTFTQQALVIFDGDAAISQKPLACGTIGKSSLSNSLQQLVATQSVTGPGPCIAVELATDADNYLYNTWGSNTNNQILSLANVVDGVFQANYNGLKVRVVAQFANTNYNSATNDYLNQAARNNWLATHTNVTRDMVMTFSGQQPPYFGSVGFVSGSGLDQFCNVSNCFGLVYAGTSDAGTPYEYYTLAHEMSHILGAYHAQDINDPNGNCAPVSNPLASLMCYFAIPKANIIITQATKNQVAAKLSSTTCQNSPAVTINAQVNGQTPQYSNIICGTGLLSLNPNPSNQGSYRWYFDPAYLSSNASISPSGSNCTVSVWGFARVVGEVAYECGLVSYTFYLMPCNYQAYRYFPNPSSKILKVEFTDKAFVEYIQPKLTLVNQQNTVVLSADYQNLDALIRNTTKPTVEFNLQALRSGTYYLHVRMGDEVAKHQIIINK